MSGAPLPSSFDGNEDFYNESRRQKILRRLREEPLIPLGCVLTAWALLAATRAIRTGDHARTNIMFRRRIYAQGFTLVAMLAGSAYWSKDRDKRKEYEGVVAERKRKEKHEAWLRELEARDVEEKEYKAKRAARRAATVAAAGQPGSPVGPDAGAAELAMKKKGDIREEQRMEVAIKRLTQDQSVREAAQDISVRQPSPTKNPMLQEKKHNNASTTTPDDRETSPAAPAAQGVMDSIKRFFGGK